MLLLRYFLFLTPVVKSIYIGYMAKRKGHNSSEIERLKSLIFADGKIAPFYLRMGGTKTCGMSLLSEEWAVTAAHCLETFSTSGIEVNAGLFDYRTDSDGTFSHGTIQTREAEMTFLHPLYGKFTGTNNDVALVKFAQPFEFNENVTKIDIDDKIPSTGERVTMAGFGRTYQSGTMKLRYITQPVPEQRLVNAAAVDDSIFCHGRNGMKVNFAGQGDSGGPVWIVRDGVPKLAGAVSYGLIHIWRNAYTCSAALPKMHSWIKETMKRKITRLTPTKSKQVFSWSNKGRNHDNEFIIFDCGNCTVSIKHFEWDFGRSEESCQGSFIEIYNEAFRTIKTKSGIMKLTPNMKKTDYYNGWNLTAPLKINIYGTFTPGRGNNVKIKFNYRLFDEKQRVYETETCDGHKSFRCDEEMDCMDMRDEIDCNYNDTIPEKQNKYTVGCYPDDYKCPGESKCIRQSQICDFAEDCIYGEDEYRFRDNSSYYCNYTKVFYSHATGIGSIISGISVVSLFHMCVYL
ncbi:ovochymase-2-like [Bolinopsis microptera]|uniref:ovochymase-2-like n=1 Tax=Bolinopsis microptera TaxID=2820187 RepID=UPI00307A12E0